MASNLFPGQAILFTVACGNPKYAKQAMALAMSVRLHGCTAPFVLLSDTQDPEVSRWFEAIVPPVAGVEPYLQKLVGLETTEATRVLFLDSDSLALRNLDDLLKELEGKPFVAMGDWITDGVYWGSTATNMAKLGVDKIARMNGGLMYYERHPDGEKVISESLAISRDYEKRGLDRLVGKIHDEGCVSPALSVTGLGELIPDTAGYSLTPWTCVGVEFDVVKGRFEATNGYRGVVRSVKPYIYHSAMAGWDMRYWRQVRRLLVTVRKAQALKLESGRGMTFFQRLSRKTGVILATLYKKIFLRGF